jgi:hypothetical protein
MCGERDDVRIVGGCAQVQGAVGSAGVVVLEVFVEDVFEVGLAEEEHAVSAFGSHGADPAFGVGVHSGALGCGVQYLDVLGIEDGVERVGELSGPVE